MTVVLVTGGAGFIGSHLVRRYVERGDEVHVAVRESSDLWRLRDVEDRIVLHQLDLRDRAALRLRLDMVRADVLYHMAVATRPRSASAFDEMSLLIDEDLKILAAVAGAAADATAPPAVFVRTGSLAEFGAAPSPQTETARDLPLTAYAASLAAGTQFLNALSRHAPYSVANVRLSLTYGPTQSTRFLVPSLIEKLTAGERVVVRNPKSGRDFIFVEDVVDALLRLAEIRIDDCACLNICSGEAISARLAAQTVCEAVGADPALIEYGEGGTETGAAVFWGSTDLAAERLGWRATTRFEDGVRRTVAAQSEIQAAT